MSPTTTDVSPTFKITDPPTSSKPAECHFKPLPISRERFWDKQLHGHVIRHQSVISEIQCEDLCLRVPGCLAYNYQYSGENNEAWRACELMNRVTAVKDSVGYSFRLFERERAIKVSNDLHFISAKSHCYMCIVRQIGRENFENNQLVEWE